MAPKVLVILTSQAVIPANNHPSGWFLPEFAHPFDVLTGKVDLTVASPKGGEAPLDPGSIKFAENDASSVKFLQEQKSLWENTVKLADVLPKAAEFDAIFYVGGHGPMFDLTNDPESIALIEKFDAAKKPIAAVCHGPAALLQAKTSSGQPLIQGVEVTGLSNAEEDLIGTTPVMPFLLETELEKLSGKYVKTEPFGNKVVVSPSGNGTSIITGQNPASGTGVGEEILKALGL
ncbi:ThiJ/PfpI family protein [Penicillium alfredii]|uniref:D-lactate dehydratase n=1 Tax=Penicillium alfredii TaxID=1506179 RepID=A0A9W9K335_9EURO|nr:ThiJ/PfpI family protein [Penicillium alfredii]KAJ5091303.1 ThiJ/PfpI family protein [Penicillium alfredii]